MSPPPPAPQRSHPELSVGEPRPLEELQPPEKKLPAWLPPEPEPEQLDWLGLSCGDQLVVSVMAAILVIVTGIDWLRMTEWGRYPIEIDRLPVRKYDYRIEINEAGEVEWGQIEGIGEKTARKIVADREANGPFRNIDDLKRVRGIGDKTVARIRPFLRDRAAESSTKPQDSAGDQESR